jgi:hypothetical protein
VSPDTFVILAVGPEAQMDSGGFGAAVARAAERYAELDLIALALPITQVLSFGWTKD